MYVTTLEERQRNRGTQGPYRKRKGEEEEKNTTTIGTLEECTTFTAKGAERTGMQEQRLTLDNLL